MKSTLRAMAERVFRRLPVSRAAYAQCETLRRTVSGMQQQLADAGRYRQAIAGLPPDLDIIVPVCNAARWLEVICDGYDALRLLPLFIVDERSTDRSLDILRLRRCRIVQARSEFPWVESLLFGVVPNLKAKWLLRVDDDELPTHGLLQWITANLDALDLPVVGIPRYWVTGSPAAGWMRTRCTTAGGIYGPDRQFRLFQPREVKPTQALHTCGFELGPFRDAPAEAALYHFDWLVRSYEQRKRKVARYDKEMPGLREQFAGFYLPEDQTADFYDFTPMDDPLIAPVCTGIAALPSTPEEPSPALQHPAEQTAAPADGVESFVLMGVSLQVPASMMTPEIRAALVGGYYEAMEAGIVARLLRAGDVVLEIGAAIGFLSTRIAGSLTSGRIVAYEANPRMIEVARDNIRRNRASLELVNAMVTGDEDGGTGIFYLHPAFWASSQQYTKGEPVSVPQRSLGSILREVRPDLLIVDIEGGERGLFRSVTLTGVRNVVIELHGAVIGQAGIDEVFRDMSQQGFSYNAELSSAHVVVFSPLGTTVPAR